MKCKRRLFPRINPKPRQAVFQHPASLLYGGTGPTFRVPFAASKKPPAASCRRLATSGRLWIDRNPVENTIPPAALGKKSWLFIGEASAGDRGAILYTTVESCRRRGIDPSAYLRDIFSRLPRATTSQIKDLTPAAWLRNQERTSQRKAA